MRKVKSKIKDAIFDCWLIKMLALIFILSVKGQAIAQERFSPGFYVTKSQDTVRGYIANKVHYSKQILFRTTISGSSQILTVDDIRSFGLSSGEVYYPMKFENHSKLPETPTFIRMIVGGGIELFKYRGQYIIGSEEKGRFPMAKGKTSNASHRLKDHQTNIGIFNILFQDCPSVKAEAQNAHITDEKLSQLIKSYHDCRSLPHREFHAKKLERGSHVGFFVGQSSSKFSIPDFTSEANSSFPFRSKFSTAFQPTFGVMSLHSGRGPASIFAFQGELAYTKADFGSTWIYTNNVGGYQIKETTVTNVDMNLITVRGGMRVTARSRKINPYVNFGLAYQKSISHKATINQITVINSVSEEENYEFEMEYSSLVFWAGAGLKKNVFGKHVVFVDSRYEESFMSNSGKITSLELRLGFLF